MKKCILFFMTLPALAIGGQKTAEEVIQSLDKSTSKYEKLAFQIWNNAEVGYLETKSSEALQNELKNAGFAVMAGVAEIPTAFVASYGEGSPVIGILAEFDALPGLSQKAVPEKSPIIEGNPGHACGHHLFGTASTAAGISIKNWMVANNIKGTIRVFGTPAEEGGAGKVYMVRAGLFNDVDAVLHWHPGSANSASASSSLANKSAKFRFYGLATHASASPHRGRSALDGVEAMNMMVNMLREHVPMESRIHYIITSGGSAPNIVPDYAEVYYYIRHPETETVKDLFERVVKAAEGAAIGTGTTMEYEVIHGIYNLLPNKVLAEMMHENLSEVGGVIYDEKEMEFARKIIATYGYEVDESIIEESDDISPFEVRTRGSGGSTDVGDISWVVPTAGLRAATWVPGTSAHSWQAVAAGGMSIGTKGMMVAAKTISLTAMDIFQNPDKIKEAKAELLERRGNNFKYQPLLGDRKPPLDYRLNTRPEEK